MCAKEYDQVKKSDLDFVHYRAKLTPNFGDKSISGSVAIDFKVTKEDVSQITFSAKNKDIYTVVLNGKMHGFTIENDTLIISTNEKLNPAVEHQLTVNYRAQPKRGVKFFDDHMFTVYHTKNWLVAHNNIVDKATFELELTHDKHQITQGNGKLISVTPIGQNKLVSHWQQTEPMPVYTFGFAVGNFEQLSQTLNGTTVSYLYRKSEHTSLTKKNVESAFKDVADMLEFFTNKAGFELPQNTYTYVIVDGYMAQEATGFSLVGEKFVHTVLEDKNENWFIAHELAHEWWGNNITCANFSHFWLNEGLVQFLVAAYKEHLFGKEAYIREIELANKRVARAIAKDRSAPVAFRRQIDESEINRTMAYSKGALVFHKLRTELGDETFWHAIRHYSKKHQNKSVTTDDLKHSLEEVTEQNFTEFFQQWVYDDRTPSI